MNGWEKYVDVGAYGADYVGVDGWIWWKVCEYMVVREWV